MEMNELPLRYRANDQAYEGLLLRDPGKPLRAVVALLPDWRGQSPLVREHARALIEQGCAVGITDLYGGGFSPTDFSQVRPMVERLLQGRDQGVAALAACIAALQESFPDLPVFCVGYSAGGMVALDYGRSGAQVAGIVLCSALLKTALPGRSARIQAPVLIVQGTQDQVSPLATIHDVITEMDGAGNDVRFLLLTQTHHAFDNPEAGTDPNARLVYSPVAASRAREAIAQFILGIAAEPGPRSP